MNPLAVSVKDLSLNFGGIQAIKQLSLDIECGSITSIIGPNGAGKTSLLNSITGVYSFNSGAILINGSETKPELKAEEFCIATLIFLASTFLTLVGFNCLTLWQDSVISLYEFSTLFDYKLALSTLINNLSKLIFSKEIILAVVSGFIFTAAYVFSIKKSRGSSSSVAKLGVARTFQNIRLFESMSALENVETGFQTKHTARKSASELLEFVGFSREPSVAVSSLSYGERRRVEIARALAAKPKIIILDEPAAGMNLNEVKSLSLLLKELKNIGMTVILVEHNMQMVMQVSETVIVLDNGSKIAEGTPEIICKDPRVISAYLGTRKSC